MQQDMTPPMSLVKRKGYENFKPRHSQQTTKATKNGHTNPVQQNFAKGKFKHQLSSRQQVGKVLTSIKGGRRKGPI
jgi:hypothetical protein